MSVGMESGATLRSLPSPIQSDLMYRSARWDRNKIGQRAFVFDHLRDYCQMVERPKILTLCGEACRFEQRFIDENPEGFVVSCEKNTRTFERLWRWMPRTKNRTTQIHDVQMPWGQVTAATTDRMCCLHLNAEAMFMKDAKAIEWNNADGFRSQHRWRWYTRDFIGVWMDLTVPIGHSTTSKILSHGIGLLMKSMPSMFAITVFLGRDCPEVMQVIKRMPGSSAVDRRLAYFKWRLEASGLKVGCTESYVHESASERSTSKMLTLIAHVAPPL